MSKGGGEKSERLGPHEAALLGCSRSLDLSSGQQEAQEQEDSCFLKDTGCWGKTNGRGKMGRGEISERRDGVNRDPPLDPYRALTQPTGNMAHQPEAWASSARPCYSKRESSLRSFPRQPAGAEHSCLELSCRIGLWSGQSVQPRPHPLLLPTSGECPGQKSGPAHPALCSDNLPEGEAGCLEGNGAE